MKVYLQSDKGEQGYTVRDRSRGPVLGYVQIAARRFWIAICERCGEAIGNGRTRPAAARRLPEHWEKAHRLAEVDGADEWPRARVASWLKDLGV